MIVSAVAPRRTDSWEFDCVDQLTEIAVLRPKSSMIEVRFVDFCGRAKITILMELLDWLFYAWPSSKSMHQHTYRTGRCYHRTLTCVPNDCAEKENEVDSFNRTATRWTARQRSSVGAQTNYVLISPSPSIRRDNEWISWERDRQLQRNKRLLSADWMPFSRSWFTHLLAWFLFHISSGEYSIVMLVFFLRH